MNRIKELRLKQHLSQQQLAKAVGLSNQGICWYEKGKRHPKIENWQKLADFFGVSVAYLRGKDEPMKLYIFSQDEMIDACPSFTVLAKSEDSAWKQITDYIKYAIDSDMSEYAFGKPKFETDRNYYHVQVYDVTTPMVAPHFAHD